MKDPLPGGYLKLEVRVYVRSKPMLIRRAI